MPQKRMNKARVTCYREVFYAESFLYIFERRFQCRHFVTLKGKAVLLGKSSGCRRFSFFLMASCIFFFFVIIFFLTKKKSDASEGKTIYNIHDNRN